MEPYENPFHKYNSPEFHSGDECIIKGCTNPGGTAWSPYFCQKCNADRINRISEALGADHTTYVGTVENGGEQCPTG